MSSTSTYRLQYYEDDVVKYTQSGKHPVIPERYKEHKFYWKGHKHILKSFYTREQAEISLHWAKWRSYNFGEKYVIFYCPKCCMYHITSETNYKKYVEKSVIDYLY